MRRICSVSLMMVALVGALLAQSAPRPHAAEMKKLDFLVGRWSGEGWIEMGPGRQFKFKSDETVESRLGGTVLTVEGRHRGQFPGRAEEVTVHHAFAVISYDERQKSYRFLAHQMDGNFVEAGGRWVDGAFQWGFRHPERGEMRYTIRLDAEGRWTEIGENSADGREWRKFFEMSLTRKS